MSPLARSLLALAAAAALLQAACAVPETDFQCTTVTKGRKQGDERVLDLVIIKAGQRTANIEVPRTCVYNINLAEEATACDDLAPKVRLVNWPASRRWSPNTSVIVTRRGNYQHYDATVNVTLWCPH